MSFYEPSKLVDGQAKFSDRMQSGEYRTPNSSAINTARSGALASPSLNLLRDREDRAVKAYFPIRKAATNGVGRAALHTGANGDSQSETITWSTFSEPFSISLEQGNNNVLSFDEQYAADLKNAVFNIIKRVDTWFVAQLVADKTQVADDHGFGELEGIEFDYQVALADEDLFFENVQAYLEGNDYMGGLSGILDSRLKVLANKISNQGSGNSLNTQFTVEGYDSLTATNKTILDVTTPDYKASGIFFETGLVGVLDWIPKKNRKPLDPSKIMNNVGDFGSFHVEELGMDFAISAYSTRVDGSSENGTAQDVKIQFEISVDMAYVSAPLSTANASVVHTAGILPA